LYKKVGYYLIIMLVIDAYDLSLSVNIKEYTRDTIIFIVVHACILVWFGLIYTT